MRLIRILVYSAIYWLYKKHLLIGICSSTHLFFVTTDHQISDILDTCYQIITRLGHMYCLELPYCHYQLV